MIHQTYWHVTPLSNITSIRQRGLIPTIGPRALMIGETTPAIYLFADKLTMEDALTNWLGDALDETCGEDTPVAILNITLPANTDITVTHSKDTYESVCLDTIQPEYIRFYDEYYNDIKI